MRCDEFSVRFDELLDERREPLDEPDMAAHAAACRQCRRTAASVGAAIGALAEMRMPGCAAGFDAASDVPLERILEAIRRDAAEVAAGAPDSHSAGDPAPAKPTTSSISSATNSRTGGAAASLWRGSAFYALIATAATLMLAAYPVWRWSAPPPAGDPTGGSIAAAGLQTPATPTRPRAGTATPQIAVAPGAVEQEPLPSFTELARESRDSYQRLAEDTRRSLDDVLSVASVFSSDTPSYENPSTDDDGWLNEVESGLEPLKRSTLGTLDVLRHVVPADTETRS
jgi:hypothetical protein